MRSNSGPPKKLPTYFLLVDRIELSYQFGKSCPVVLSLILFAAQTAAFIPYSDRKDWHGPWKNVCPWIGQEQRVPDQERACDAAV